MLVCVPRLKLNTIVYQSRNNFKGYSFDISPDIANPNLKKNKDLKLKF